MSEHIGTTADLSDGQREEALARLALLRPFLEDGVPLTHLAPTTGIPLRTARRWVAAYRRAGLAGLARRPRADRGHARGVPDSLRRFIEGLALQTPRRSLAAIQRTAAQVAVSQGWQPATYDQVRRIVSWLDPALVTLAQQGGAVYAEAFDLLFRREASRPNEIWQADHSLLKIRLRDPDGESVQPWLTAIEDDFSRAIAGWRLSLEPPTALQTALAFRTAIWRSTDPRVPVCGLPDAFYIDHGSDFTSQHIEQVAADLGVQLIFSQVGKPRGRGKVERFFRSVEQLFLCQIPGYAPRGGGPVRPALTLPQFEIRFRDWLHDDYHQRPHGETGMAPVARWIAGGFLPLLPASVEQLDPLLLTVPRVRRVQQDGIHFQGFRYLDPMLAAYVREDVIIRYDPADLGEIRVFHAGHFLCRAICPELAGETITLKEITAARDRRRRQLRAQQAERAAVVETLLALRRANPAATTAIEEDAVPPPIAPRLRRYLHE